MESNSCRGLGDNLFVVILGVIAAIIGIFVFLTGYDSLPQIFDRLQQESDSSPPSIEERAQPTATIRPLVPDFHTISLQSWSELTSPETNLGVNPGRNHLLAVPFETGWTTSTQCSHLANQPEWILVETNIPNPAHVYLLIQAGMGFTEYGDKQIGNVKLIFADGTSHDTALKLGFNIRDWAWENPAAVNTASSASLRPAVFGEAPDGTPGGMDVLTIDIPSSQSRSTLTGIEISDISKETTGGINPCIHLVALTVEYLH